MDPILYYYRCDFAQGKAVALVKKPTEFGNINGMQNMDDTKLEDLGWAGNPQVGFIREDRMINYPSVSQESQDLARAYAIEEAKEEARQVKNQLLAETDKLVVIDRWEGYSEELKGVVADYRQTLRDFMASPDVDWLNIVWPVMPDEVQALM